MNSDERLGEWEMMGLKRREGGKRTFEFIFLV